MFFSPDWLKSKYHGKNYGILSIPGSDLMFLPGSGSGSGFEISLDQVSVPGSRIQILGTKVCIKSSKSYFLGKIMTKDRQKMKKETTISIFKSSKKGEKFHDRSRV